MKAVGFERASLDADYKLDEWVQEANTMNFEGVLRGELSAPSERCCRKFCSFGPTESIDAASTYTIED